MTSPTQNFAPVATPPAPRVRARSRSIPRSERDLSALRTPAPAVPTIQAIPASTSLAGSAHLGVAHRSRHSLYGTEDRVVLDLGSRVWKVGYSGEPGPRVGYAVGRAGQVEGEGDMWGLSKKWQGEEDWIVRRERLKRGLRRVWFKHLMSDPKARKVIVIENPLLPTRLKEVIAEVLFDNLQVPSVSFTCAPVLSLLATGASTGLVVDLGNLESTVIPIYHTRPLFPLLHSTPRAGARLTARLRALLLRFGRYSPPPQSLNSTSTPTIGRVPPGVLTDEFVESLKTRCCFVGDALTAAEEAAVIVVEHSWEQGRMQVERASQGVAGEAYEKDEDEEVLARMERRWAARATATTIGVRIPGGAAGAAPGQGVGKGWIQVPGWVRERAAEVLFEEGGTDQQSVQEIILECLLKLPLDLRRPLAASILVTGGTAMLPGLFPRLRHELLATLGSAHPPSPPPTPPLAEPTSDAATPPPGTLMHAALKARLHAFRRTPRFAPLAPLALHVVLANDPSRTGGGGRGTAFAPALAAWVGGSLVGALKTGGEEVARERWEEMRAEARGREEAEAEMEEDEGEVSGRGMGLPDWTELGKRGYVG